MNYMYFQNRSGYVGRYRNMLLFFLFYLFWLRVAYLTEVGDFGNGIQISVWQIQI